MLHPLKMKPSELLLRFAAYLEAEGVDFRNEKELTDERIFELQRGFITRIFSEKGVKKLLPLALDLITYNYHYAAALLAVPPPLPATGRLARLEPATLRLQLAGSARLAVFSYDILEVLEMESGDLRALAAALSQNGIDCRHLPEKRRDLYRVTARAVFPAAAKAGRGEERRRDCCRAWHPG